MCKIGLFGWFVVTQGHYQCQRSIGHIWLPIRL